MDFFLLTTNTPALGYQHCKGQAWSISLGFAFLSTVSEQATPYSKHYILRSLFQTLWYLNVKNQRRHTGYKGSTINHLVGGRGALNKLSEVLPTKSHWKRPSEKLGVSYQKIARFHHYNVKDLSGNQGLFAHKRHRQFIKYRHFGKKHTQFLWKNVIVFICLQNFSLSINSLTFFH